jgi:XTP/dITP diphosphohydrolase
VKPILILLGSNNSGKVSEYAELLKDVPADLAKPRDLGLELTIDETGESYTENARLKALGFAGAAPGVVALADDSGLELAAFGGWPGLHSVRFAGPDADDGERRRLVLDRLAKHPDLTRRARFVCAIAVARDGILLAEAVGVLEGTIALAEAGSSGFGYDPIFIPQGYSQTLGELAPSNKNWMSHRARALAQVRPLLLRLAREGI